MALKTTFLLTKLQVFKIRDRIHHWAIPPRNHPLTALQSFELHGCILNLLLNNQPTLLFIINSYTFYLTISNRYMFSYHLFIPKLGIIIINYIAVYPMAYNYTIIYYY